jgi:inosine-uridine nucleoside N-ribohydrolase
MYAWDPLAAVIATDESVAEIEDRGLAVLPDGSITIGAVQRPIRVAIDADKERFETI